MTRPFRNRSRFLCKELKKRHASPAARLARICEWLERRELLTGVDFLQGTVTLAGAPQANVTIELKDVTANTSLPSTMTNGNGYYHFEGLTAGDTYDITEVPPSGSSASAAQISETPVGINASSVVNTSTIQVTLGGGPGSGPYFFHHDGDVSGNATDTPVPWEGDGLFPQNFDFNVPSRPVSPSDPLFPTVTTLPATGDLTDLGVYAGLFHANVNGSATPAGTSSDPNLPANATFDTYCVDLRGGFTVDNNNHNVGPTFQVMPEPLTILELREGTSAANVGEIAWLFNHYGQNPSQLGTDLSLSGYGSGEYGAALQIAMWQLLTNGDTSQFKYDPSTPDVTTLINDYLNQASGKSEDAIYLDAMPFSDWPGDAQSVIATANYNFTNVGTPQLTITKVPDSGTVTAGSTIGFTVTISNPGGATASGLMLTDPLPPGGNEFFNWSIDTTKGNPADFAVNGSPGSQSLAFSSAFLAGPDSLAPGQSISVHITTPTTAGDVSGGAVGLQSGPSSAAYLGAAGNYGVLYMVDSGTHNLSITNVTLGANVGVGSGVGGNGVGNVTFSGPGIVTGRVDFAPGQTDVFNNQNGSNVGPASVNTNVAAVTSAISTVTSLNSSLGALTGTSISINGTQTINESAGTFHTVNGVTYSVFTVKSYSENDGKIFTINGDGSGDPVVLNFGPSIGNVNLGGDVALTGNGLNDDKVIWNFTSSNQNLQLNNNASSFFTMAFHGIILAPNDVISTSNGNLSGRIFGGGNQDMQLVSGLTQHAPLLNTATVTSGTLSASASSLITVTGSFRPTRAAPAKGSPTLAAAAVDPLDGHVTQAVEQVLGRAPDAGLDYWLGQYHLGTDWVDHMDLPGRAAGPAAADEYFNAIGKDQS